MDNYLKILIFMAAFACDAPRPVKPPPTSYNSDKNSATQEGGDTAAAEGEIQTETPTDTVTTTPPPADVDPGGATFEGPIEEMDARSKECAENGKFFDRRIISEGKLGLCTDLSYAPLDCNVAAIDKFYADKGDETSREILADFVAASNGFKLDRCIACDPAFYNHASCSNIGLERYCTKITQEKTAAADDAVKADLQAKFDKFCEQTTPLGTPVPESHEQASKLGLYFYQQDGSALTVKRTFLEYSE